MLELNKGVDILTDVGGVTTIAEARDVIGRKLDAANQNKLAPITNEDALIKIAAAINMCEPDDVFINTGSPEDVKWIREYSLEKGEERPLAKKGHTIHFDLPQDQARLVNQTFYIVNEDEKISALAKKIVRDEGLEYVQHVHEGHHEGQDHDGRLLLPRSRWAPSASTPAIEISSIDLRAALGRAALPQLLRQVRRRGRAPGHLLHQRAHAEGPNRPEDVPNARIFMDRSWLTTFSTFCTYAGNTLLMKKGNHRFSVDYATYYGNGEGTVRAHVHHGHEGDPTAA